ncbi:hypothetical protein 1 [Sanxia sobemo-like virus 3]|uniref:hypothetical protein 1 n=1 Tax=Sanxia sobemo-like virus 3 TaxID=1923382 RepID=UPI00090BE43D|nr:hypothetical protein 1 [Sanxia sobemo-like virus 3]APG75870.1 hypothetical protein 1 [Sanxia sobemo-like virus 3]
MAQNEGNRTNFLTEISDTYTRITRAASLMVRIGIYYATAVSFCLLYRLTRWVLSQPVTWTLNAAEFVEHVFYGVGTWALWPLDKGADIVVSFLSGPKPEPTVTERIIEEVNEKAEYLYSFSAYLPSLCYITMVVLIVLLLWVLSRRYLRTTLMRMRGVYIGESMRNGSKFMPAQIPSGQVAVMSAGMLVDNHIGYGLRVGNVLVTPYHVIRDIVNPILSYGGKKICVNVAHVVASKCIPDVAYLMLDETQWTRLGVPKVKVVTKTTNVATSVTCVGLSGQSVGLLRKSSRIGMMIYSGSTIPGMSGAGYFVNNQCHGMHNGVIMHDNVGVSMSCIYGELKMIFRGESSHDFGEEVVKKSAGVRIFKTWSDEDLVKQFHEMWQEPDFEEDISGAWGMRLGEESADKIIKLTGQSPDQPEMVYRTTVECKSEAELRERIIKLEQVVEALKIEKCDQCSAMFVGVTLAQHKKQHSKHPCISCTNVFGSKKDLEQHVIKTHVKYPCDHCGVVCRTEVKLKNHRESCKVSGGGIPMKNLKGESAFAMDHKKIVKTDPFLGQQRTSRKKNGRSSERTSPAKVANHRSPSQEEILCQILQSQKNMQQNFEKFLQVMAGPKPATTQN